jgi:molybdopterin/thiamine biosynthesis adenylyltransferase/rhodanese-related sulfurtransferase
MERYKSQISMIGIEGQRKINESSVLIIGLGGLGCPIALQLALSGVGVIGIVDDDIVSLSNLHRQILYQEFDIGKKKVEVAVNNLKKFNSSIEIRFYNKRLNEKNCLDLIKNYDYIVDASDNFQTRYLLNDACFFEKKTLISGSVFQFEGRLITFTENSACLRCIQPIANMSTQSCSDGGIMNMITGVIASMQVSEVIKLILKKGENSINVLTKFDALKNEIKKFKILRDENCELCSVNSKIKGIRMIDMNCGKDEKSLIIEIDEFLKNRDKYFLIDVRTKEERVIDGIINNDFWFQLDLLYQDLSKIENLKDKEIVIYCHAGVRSLSAAKFLKDNGFQKVQSLNGGIRVYNTKKLK